MLAVLLSPHAYTGEPRASSPMGSFAEAAEERLEPEPSEVSVQCPLVVDELMLWLLPNDSCGCCAARVKEAGE